MDLGLTGKVAIINLAGASGMGACVGRLLAQEGARVVLADIQAEKGQAMAAEIRQRGGDATFIEANMSIRPQVDQMITSLLASHGQIDIMCNIAGPGASSVSSTPTKRSIIASWMVICVGSSTVCRQCCRT